MFGGPIVMGNGWNDTYRTLGYGNYGFGLYSQDVELIRNPITGRINIERELDFIPTASTMYRPYASFPAAVYHHYIN